jgi:hypothetical protein
VALADIERLRYYPLQYLGAADFDDEQSYLREMRRRHNVGQHAWGIVVGMDLVQQLQAGSTDQMDVYVLPGLAVDGFGREIVILEPYLLNPVDFAAFAANVPQTLPVWLAYLEEDTRGPAFGYAQCDASNQFSRVREGYKVVVQPPPPTHSQITVAGRAAQPPDSSQDQVYPSPDPNSPTLPPDECVPFQEFPDETSGPEWLLPLGWVKWDGKRQVFLAASADDLIRDRHYAGAVAAEILAPAISSILDSKSKQITVNSQLRLRPRMQPTDPDLSDFASVEGRLRVDGSLNARRDVLVDGGKLSFRDSGGKEDNAPLWLQRQVPAVGSGSDLRLHIGRPADATARLSVGPGPDDGSAEQIVLAVRADNSVRIPTGTLDFETTRRQMINLWSTLYGVGIQDFTLYFRSDADFCWFRGGTPSTARDDPGAGGTLNMKLAQNGDLTVTGNVGVGVPSPQAQMHIAGGSWDLTSTEGDLKIGDDSFRLKIGVARGGGGAGDVRIRAHGGTNRLILGGGVSDALTIQNGSVGIGTLSPQQSLSVNAGINLDQANVNDSNLNPGLTFGFTSGEGIASKRTVGGNQWGLDFYTASAKRLAITNGGRVGIGTDTPQALLHVNGSFQVGSAGVALTCLQTGTFTIGSSGTQNRRNVSVNFPSAFPSTPSVLATARGGSFPDGFAVTTTSISTTGFQVNIYRVDATGGWGQSLQLDWLAWTT